MRLLLLFSALGAAHAQLMPNSPWPMRGQNLRHTGNGLVAAPGNSAVVVKYKTGAKVSSSPAVDGPLADGTVYVGSYDGYLHAVDPLNGKPKWTYKTGDKVSSSPAVGADGTVYVGSGDTYLHAITADGKPKWTYKTEGAIFFSSPAVGADGTVYVGSGDGYLYGIGLSAGYVTSLLHLAQRMLARNETTEPLLQHICSLPSPPQPYPLIPETTNLIDTSCQIIAKTSCSSPPYSGLKGFATPLSFTEYKGGVTIITKSDDGTLYGIGISAGLVTSSLHSAQRALASFETDSAVSQLQRLCDFKSSAHANDGSSGFDNFTTVTVNLIDTSCQILAGTRNSPSHGLAWWSFVTPLSFNEYKKLISTGGTMMTLLQSYEKHLRTFVAEETTIDDRIATAKDAVKGYAADETNWKGVLKRDKADMSAYGTEIVTIGQQMDSKYAVLQTDVLKLIKHLNTQLQDLKKELVAAKDEDARKKAWSVFSAIFKVVKAAVSVAACFAESVETAGAALLVCGKENIDAIKGAVGGITDCVNTIQSSCKKCNDLKKEIKEAKDAEKEINALAGMAKAAQALNAQLSTGKDLPEELPLLISESISMNTLRADAELFRQELVKTADADGGDAFVNDIRDWTELGVTRVSLFLSYYNIATRVQNDEGQLTVLQTRANIVWDRLEDEQNKEAAVISAAYLMYERQQKQAMLIIKYLYEEVKQYQYFSLTTLQPPIKLIENPQMEDILGEQQRLEGAYLSEMAKQKSGSNLAYIYIEVNQAAEPSTLESMRINASTSVLLPIPLKNSTDPATNAAQLVANTTYYQIRIRDVAVYLLDESGKPLGNGSVQVKIEKSGISSFFDSNMDLHVFTHAPVKFGAGSFVYNSETGCPLSESDCGALCTDYIRYSPFGKWNVTVDKPTQQGVDLSKLASIRFQFQIDYRSTDGDFSRNWFGKDPERYPQDIAARCLPLQEEEEAALMQAQATEKDEV